MMFSVLPSKTSPGEFSLDYTVYRLQIFHVDGWIDGWMDEWMRLCRLVLLPPIDIHNAYFPPQYAGCIGFVINNSFYY